MSTCPPHSGRGWASAQPGRLQVLFRMQRCLEIWTSFSRCILIWGFRLSMRLGNVLAMCCFTVFMLIYVLTVFGCLCLIFTFCTAHCIQLWFIFLKCSRNKVELKWVDEFFVLSYTIWDTSELQTPITPDPINSHWVFFAVEGQYPLVAVMRHLACFFFANRSHKNGEVHCIRCYFVLTFSHCLQLMWILSLYDGHTSPRGSVLTGLAVAFFFVGLFCLGFMGWINCLPI